MATSTSNYNLILAEGTDLVNYLTDTNPNFTSLDTIIKGVSDCTVSPATEVASGTAHAISRSLTDAPVLRFTATSNWVLGDTMTIDGVTVQALKPNGTNLQTGDYVIGAEVLGVLNGTRFTVYIGGASGASNITYDNTGSGLTATNVQDAIDENAASISAINSSVSQMNNWKFFYGALTGDSVYGSIYIPNASESFMEIVSSGAQPYHLQRVNPNSYVIRDGNGVAQPNITVAVIALYLD